jgi:hypothetical protein
MPDIGDVRSDTASHERRVLFADLLQRVARIGRDREKERDEGEQHQPAQQQQDLETQARAHERPGWALIVMVRSSLSEPAKCLENRPPQNA